MRQQGKLTEWNDARGFGFVQPNGGGDRCFVHIRAFTARDRRPALGDVITYEVQRDAQGRLNAAGMRFALQRDGTRSATGTHARPHNRRDRLPRTSLALLFLSAMVIAAALGRCPHWMAAAYLGLSGVTYLFYWHDKAAAQRDQQRTPENVLQMLALFGGWPGALIAQATLRHKNRKTSFQIVFWLVVALNVAALWWVCRHYR